MSDGWEKMWSILILLGKTDIAKVQKIIVQTDIASLGHNKMWSKLVGQTYIAS